MAIATRAIERIKAFARRRTGVGWFVRPLGDPGVLTSILFFRFIASLGLVLRFGLYQDNYSDEVFLAVRVSLLLFFAYFCALLFAMSFAKEVFLSHRSTWIQLVVDVLVTSFIYFLTQNVRSEIFALYFLPLLIAAEYFSFAEAVGALVFTSILFAITAVMINLKLDQYDQLWIWRVFLPRQFFLFTLAGTFLHRRRFRVSSDLVRQQRALAPRLEHAEDGVYVVDAEYRLLFASHILRQRHGDDFCGRKCFAYFTRSNTPCEACSCAHMLKTKQSDAVQQIVRQICVDKNGQRYLAEVALSPVFSGNDGSTMFVGVLRNQSERQDLRGQLEQYIYQAERAAVLFSAEVRQKNDLLNRRLASVFSASLAAVGADRHETLSRMLQVTVEMLGCQSGALRLIDKNPKGRECLVLNQAFGYSPIWQERRRYLNLDEKSISVDCFLSGQAQIYTDVPDSSAGQGLWREFAKQAGLRSAICFPLVLREHRLGTMSLYRSTVREYTSDEVSLGQSIANYMAVIIENFRLYEDKSAQAAEQAQWLDAIHQVSRQLAGFESLDSLMYLAVQIAKDRLNSEVSSIFLLDGGRLKKRATAGVEAGWLAEESYGVGEGLTGSCLTMSNGAKYGHPVLENVVDQSCNVLKENVREYQARLGSGQVKHLIVVPLNGRDGTFGVLRVVNKLDEEGRLCETGFEEGDVNLLNIIACEVGIAVEKVRLLDEAQQHLDELSQLQRCSQALVASLDLQSVLDEIAALAADLVQVDAAKVVLAEGDHLVVGAHSSPNLASLLGSPRSDGMTRKVVETGTPVVVDEVSDDGIHNPDLVAMGVCSYAGVPIIRHDRVLGVLYVLSLYPRALEEKIPFLMTFAGQAAIAIENSRSYELEQKRRRIAETLQETSTVVGSALDLRHLLPLILDQVRLVVPYDTASVQLLSGDRLEIIACRGFDDPEHVRTLVFPVTPKFPNYRVVESKAPYVVDDVRPRYSSFHDERYRAAHIRSWLGVPLLFRDQVIGMMSLDSKTERYYDEEHARLAMVFANQAAVVIRNAQLFQDAQDRLSESTALLDVSRRLTETLDLQLLLDVIIESAVDLIGPAEGGVIHLLDKDTQMLVPAAFRLTQRFDLESATLMEVGHGIAGHALEELQTIRVNEVALDSRFDQPAKAPYFDSLLVAPLHVGCGQKPIGTLSVHSGTTGAFSEAHERLLSTLASQAATAIANAELFSVRQQKREQLQSILHVYKDFDVDMGMDELLQTIAQAARESLGFCVALLEMVDPSGENVIVQAVGEPDDDWQCSIIGNVVPLAKIEDLMREDHRTGRSFLFRHGQELWDIVAENRRDALSLSQERDDRRFPEVGVLVPLETQDDRLIGILALGEPCRGRLPSKDDLQVAEVFASTATVAIENARLFQSEQRRATQMSVINTVAREATSVLEPESLLQTVASSIQKGFGYYHVALFLNEAPHGLVVHASSGAYVDEMPPEHLVPLGRGMVGWAASSGATRLANDVAADHQYFEGFPAAAATRAELSVPLKVAGRVTGVLDIQSERLNAFDNTDVIAMETLSDQIAVAIENARLFSRVRQLLEFNENIVQSMEGGVLMEDAEGLIRFVNPKMGTMLGYPQGVLVGQHWSKIVPPMWKEKVAVEKEKLLQGVKGRYEALLLHRDGIEVPVVANANPLFQDNRFVGVLTVFTDIAETRRRIAEAERDRLQGELHEALNVLHAGVMLEAEATQHWLREGQHERVGTALDRLWKVSRYTYGELDNILQDLRDPILEKEGLVAALRTYAETIKPDLIQVNSNMRGRLARDCEHALFRIAQGAISNALRHAGLENVPDGRIQVRLVKEDENVTLRIEDNGTGFNVDAVKRGYPGAFGLERMYQWAKTIGATLETESDLGVGTVVTATVSLDDDGDRL